MATKKKTAKKAAKQPAKPGNGRRLKAPGRSSKADAAELNAKALAKRAADGDPGALQAMERIVVSFEKWKRALAKQQQERAACKDLVGGAEALFEQKVEAPMPVGSTASDWPITKLREVEVAWQDLTEAKAEQDERLSSAAADVKKWGSALERAMREGAQLVLPHTEGTGEASGQAAAEPEQAESADNVVQMGERQEPEPPQGQPPQPA